MDALMAIGHLTSRQEARLSAVIRERAELIERRKRRRTMRKRKKRRKRKTPKTSSSCGRVHRRQQQCYVHDWFSWCCSSRCVLSFGRQAQDATPGPLCTRRTVISGLCLAGFAGHVTFALCSLLLSAGRVVHFLDKLFSPVVVQRQVPVLVRTVLSVARGDSTGAVLGRVYCHVNRWITDPEVDSRLSGRVFLPLYLTVTCSLSPAEYTIWIFWEMASGIHVFSAIWVDSGYMLASVYAAFGRISHFFLRSGGLWETTSGLSPYSALSLGRQWIHVGFCLRGLSPYSALSLVRQRIHAVRQSARFVSVLCA